MKFWVPLGYHVWLYNVICGFYESVFRWFMCEIENCIFRVPWVPLWYPKTFVLKSMMFGLSNAVSHAWFGYLSVFAHSFGVLSFLCHFQAKIHILVCIMKLNKIMNVSGFVSSDLGMLFRWSTRHLKAQASYFSTRIFLDTIVVPIVPKNDLYSINCLNFTLIYKSNNVPMCGTQNVGKQKVEILGFPTQSQPSL